MALFGNDVQQLTYGTSYTAIACGRVGGGGGGYHIWSWPCHTLSTGYDLFTCKYFFVKALTLKVRSKGRRGKGKEREGREREGREREGREKEGRKREEMEREGRERGGQKERHYTTCK